MRAWENVIELLRTGQFVLASLTYKQQAKVTQKEADEVIQEQAEKIRARARKRKEHRDEDISDS